MFLHRRLTATRRHHGGQWWSTSGTHRSSAASKAVRSVRRETTLATWAALFALMVIASALILHEGRGLTFFNDEWYFVLYRDGHDLDNFLAGHADHLVAVPVAIFLVLFKGIGLDAYWVYRVVALAAHLACVLALYLLARRRVGPVAALAPAGILLFLGSAWEDLLRPFEVAFTGAVACGLAALLLIDRDRLAGDALACAALVLGIGFSGVALPFAAATAAGLLVRGRLPARLWVPALPVGLYLLWAQKYATEHINLIANLNDVPGYALRLAGDAVAGITGLPLGLAIGLIVLLVAFALSRLLRLGGPSPLAVEALALALSFWVLIAWTQAGDGEPLRNRYIYIGVVAILLLLVGLAPRGTPGRTATAIALALAALTLPVNIADLADGGRSLRHASAVMAAELGAVEIARPTVDLEFGPPPEDFSGVTVAAGFYFASIDRYESSPADSPEEIAARPEDVRLKADLVLSAALRLAIRPVTSRDAAVGCAKVDGGHGEVVELPRAGLMIRAGRRSPVRVSLRRFADDWGIGLASVKRGGRSVIRPPPDAAPEVPWRARAAAATPFVVCRLAAPSPGSG